DRAWSTSFRGSANVSETRPRNVSHGYYRRHGRRARANAVDVVFVVRREPDGLVHLCRSLRRPHRGFTASHLRAGAPRDARRPDQLVTSGIEPSMLTGSGTVLFVP